MTIYQCDKCKKKVVQDDSYRVTSLNLELCYQCRKKFSDYMEKTTKAWLEKEKIL